MNFEQDGITFNAEFNNGFCIKKLIDFFKTAYGNAEWYFSANGINGYGYEQGSASDQPSDRYTSFQLEASSIPKYSFKSPKDVYYCRFGMNFTTLYNHAKTITKKSTVSLVKKEDSPYLGLHYNGDTTSITWIASRNDKRERVAEPVIQSEFPTCTITAKDFKTHFSKFASLKVEYVRVEVYPRGICLAANSSDLTSGYVKSFGDDIENGEKPIVSFTVCPKTLKIVSKMADVTSNPNDGIIKIWGQGPTSFMVENTSVAIGPLLKVQCSVGGYGIIQTYIFGNLLDEQ